MALFEKSNAPELPPDDTRRLSCSIRHAHTVNSHTEYEVHVETSGGSWSIRCRYRDFATLHATLSTSGRALLLPPKRLVGNMKPAFVAERQKALQAYLDALLERDELVLSRPVRVFLGAAGEESGDMSAHLPGISGVLHAAELRLETALIDVGWRMRKYYWLARRGSEPHIVSWARHGPDLCLSPLELQTALQVVSSLNECHGIARTVSSASLAQGVAVARRVLPTLRDEIYGGDHTKPHLARAWDRGARIESDRIVRISCAILRALRTLHNAGLHHGHIHPGNVAATPDGALLLDAENSLLGVASRYRPHVLRTRLSDARAIDVHCFARTLYEMATGVPLRTVTLENLVDVDVPPHIEKILVECLSVTGVRRGPPPLDWLIDQLSSHSPPPVRVRVPAHVVVYYKRAADAVAARLAVDRKCMRQERRSRRVQRAIMESAPAKVTAASPTPRPSRSLSLDSSLADESERLVSPPPPPPPPDVRPAQEISAAPPARAALLGDICSFDKSRLQRVIT